MRLLASIFKNILVQPAFIAKSTKKKISTTTHCGNSMGSINSTLLKKTTVDMDSEQAKFVREALEKHKVVIFSKTYCPYCFMAKEQFAKLDILPCVIELDERPDGDAIQLVLGQMTGSKTVPRCFINGKFVGGGTDMKRMYEDGSLQKYFS